MHGASCLAPCVRPCAARTQGALPLPLRCPYPQGALPLPLPLPQATHEHINLHLTCVACEEVSCPSQTSGLNTLMLPNPDPNPPPLPSPPRRQSMFVTWLFGPPNTPYVGLRTVRAAHLKLIKQRGFCEGKCSHLRLRLCSPPQCQPCSTQGHRLSAYPNRLASDFDTLACLPPYHRSHRWLHDQAHCW